MGGDSTGASASPPMAVGRRPLDRVASSTRTAREAYRDAQRLRFPERFRKLPVLGLILISAFYVFDVTYPWPAYVALRPRDFLVVRAWWDLFYVALLATSWLRAESLLLQRMRDHALLVGTAAFLGVVCAHTGRLASPYWAGIVLVTVARSTILPGLFVETVIAFAAMSFAFVVVACFWPSPVAPGFGGAAGLLTIGFMVSASVLALVGTWLADRLALGLEAAKIMGRYRLVRQLGGGGMGEVYLAQHASLRRPCAVKILRQELCTPAALLRFEREAEAASRLRHPNTIAVFDFGRTDEGQPYYVMEYLEGCDLRALVKRDGPLVPERAQYLLRQAASSLAEAHALGMVHRDVQPGNLFVTATAGFDDFVKVLDFGLVKGVDLGPELTRGSGFMGTPRYMSPEALTGHAVDARADVFSLGAVGYHLLCGAPPFATEDTYADMYNQIHQPPPSIHARRDPTLARPSAELVAVLLRCLEKEPARRFADAGELVRALEATPEHGRWRPQPARVPSGAHRVIPTGDDAARAAGGRRG